MNSESRKVIQATRRYEDVKAAQRSYVKTVLSMVTEAMKRLEKNVCAADVHVRRQLILSGRQGLLLSPIMWSRFRCQSHVN